MTEATQIQTTEPDWSEYRGVLVVVEQREGKAKPVSWQLLGIGRKLAQKLEVDTLALVMGHDVRAPGPGSDQLRGGQGILADDPVLKHYRTYPYSRVCLELIREIKPEIVLFGATYTGRDLAGAIATHLPTGLTADSTMLDVEPPPSRLLLASRPAFSEKMVATILCKKYRPQMATARPGVFDALPRDPSRQGEIIPFPCPVKEEDVAARVIDFIQDEQRVNLEDASVIVAGGRGLGGPERVQDAEGIGRCPGRRGRSEPCRSRSGLDQPRSPGGADGSHGSAQAVHRRRHFRRRAARGRDAKFRCHRGDQQGSKRPHLQNGPLRGRGRLVRDRSGDDRGSEEASGPFAGGEGVNPEGATEKGMITRQDHGDGGGGEMAQEKFDAIVVGAGPAGSAAAYTMAKAGLSVVLLERGEFPGAKNLFGGVLYRKQMEEHPSG